MTDNAKHVVTLLVGLVLGFGIGGIVGAQVEQNITGDNTETVHVVQKPMETILYEPGAPSIPLFKGALSVSSPLLQQSGPRWIIPMKVEPRVAGGIAQGFSYVYWNGLGTDGPYTPAIASPEDRFNARGWVP